MKSLKPDGGVSPAATVGSDPNPKRFYRVERGDVGVTCWVFRGYGVRSPLAITKTHSYNFEIGYSGSGPTELALSILADHLGTRAVSPAVYRAFRDSFLANHAHANGREITVEQVAEWLGMLESQCFELKAAS